EALPVDRDIERVAGGLQRAVGEQSHGRDGANADTDLQAGGHLRELRGLRTGLPQLLIQQILEYGALAFEAVGADVGQVVRDHVDVELLSFQPRLGNPQRSDQLSSLFAGRCACDPRSSCELRISLGYVEITRSGS